MTEPPTWLIAVTCALLSLSSYPAAAQDDPSKSVVVIQESNGFPGGEKTSRMVRQHIAVQGTKLRVLDPVHMWALFIDLDERKVREASVDRRTYVERDFEFYEKYRLERQQNLAEQAEEYKARSEKLADDPRKLRRYRDAYRRMGGDPSQPGRIVARLQYFPQDRRESQLRVGRDLEDVVLEHYMIRENQADKPIFDLWVTHNLELPVDMMRFYRELGTFSDEVSAQLQKIPGTIVECTALLDTGSLSKTFRSRVLEVRADEVIRGALTVPEDWKQQDPDAKEAVVARGPTARTCAFCEQETESKKFRYRHPRTRQLLFACSSGCRVKLIKRVNDELRKQGK